jgi:hypothetical protein
MAIQKDQQEEDQELASYNSVLAHKAQMDSLAYDLISNFNEAPELLDLDRQQVFQDAYQVVTKDYFDKASQLSQTYFSLLGNKKAFFLNNDDFVTFTNTYSSEINMQSNYAMTLRKGLILFNQELIANDITDPKLIAIYKLIKRKQFSLPDDREKMIEFLADFIPFHTRITDKSLNNIVFKKKESDGEELKAEMLKKTLWAIIYHECLHVLSSSNFFLEQFDEAATHYYTALATYKEKGTSAFRISIILAGTDESIAWIKFLRDFEINPQEAEKMYFNKDGQWTPEKMHHLFPHKQNELLKIMKAPSLSQFLAQ